MPIPILQTKLYRPPLRSDLIQRSHLVEKLNNLLQRKLTLISAPAGFGKTTLVSEWIASKNQPVAWLSLGEEDRDLVHFLTYVAAALRALHPTLGEALIEMLQSPQTPPSETVLTILINEIVTIREDLVLVLDDYHVTDSKPVDSAVAFLLDNLPPNLHLVLCTRTDPNLPLARYRAQAQLLEFRAADLRFKPEEATQFLNEMMSLNLSAADVTALETRTEGWIAGLQLAALSMQGLSKTAEFIHTFTGSHRFILDYLVEEVLRQQPEKIRDFLLQTSILDRMSGPLCDAVTGRNDSISMLADVDRGNLFVIPLDSQREWYRYHHLFAEVLRQRLVEYKAESDKGADSAIAELHLRASRWLENNGWEIEAFQHAAAANDVDRAERLIDGSGAPLYFRGIITPILDWLNSLPRSAFEFQPSLWVTWAAVLTVGGVQIEEVEEKLVAAEARLSTRSQEGSTRNLLGQMAAIRAMWAIATDDLDAMLTQSQRALDLLHPDNEAYRTTILMTLGYAHLLQGNCTAAKQAYTKLVSIAQRTENTSLRMAGSIGLGNVYEAENDLLRAADTYREVLESAGEPPPPFICAAHMGLAKICYEWNELNAAQNHAELGIHFGKQLPALDVPAASYAILARISLARGNPTPAAAHLTDADQLMRRRDNRQYRPEIEAVRTQWHLSRGEIDAAIQIAQRYDLPLALASAYLRAGDSASALKELKRAHQNALQIPAEQLRTKVAEIVAHKMHNNEEHATRLLQDALRMAEQGQHVRIFVDHGTPMAEHLSKAAEAGIMPKYVGTLLGHFSGGQIADAKQPSTPTFSSELALIEPLSPRELEVMQLIGQGLSNKEISERLYIAISTVKGHNRIIYEKLQVKRRTEAVARARELGLL